jgi:alanine dehydrogenase
MEELSPKPKRQLKSGIDPSLLTVTVEQPMRVSDQNTRLIIGIPKEHTTNENRVAITPMAVGVLTANGHQVLVEHNAGKGAQFSDKEYTENGAVMAYSASELFQKANIIVKIAPLTDEELGYLQPRQVVFSAVNLGTVRPDYLKTLISKNVTAIGFEFMQAQDGSIPIMRMLSEIAGITSIHIASELLSYTNGGKGSLLGGITGIPPAQVTVLGAGTVGYHAIRTAMAMGAFVRVIDSEVFRLQELEERLGQKIWTAVSQRDYIEEAVAAADVLIGAIHVPGKRSPNIVTEDMVMQMREHSVIVDVSIDQGGCIETSRVTSHEQPTYVEHGVIHYCVPNMSSRVPRTSSMAISNILTPLLLRVADAGGVHNLIKSDPYIRNGIYVYHRYLTQRHLARMFNMDFMELDLLHAASI